MAGVVTAADVVIIGAGFSGLSAAIYLRDAGASVIVLEARDRVGGRTCNDVRTNGDRVDTGGAYVGCTQDRLLRLADKYGIETYRVYTQGKFVCDVGGTRLTHSSIIPPLSPWVLLDLNAIFRESYSVGAGVDTREPWNGAAAQELDDLTVQQWMNQKMWTSQGKTLFRAGIRTLFCAEPAELSVLYTAWYLKSCGGIKRATDLVGGAQEYKFKQGTATVCERMAAELDVGSRVLLSSPVRKIAQDSTSVRVTTRDGRVFIARCIILALAPCMYGQIEFEPGLPAVRQQLCQRMPMGTIVKTVMYYRTAFWRTAGFNGMALSDAGPVLYTYDDTKPDGTHPAIMGFVLTTNAREFCNLTYDERKQRIARQYARSFGTDEALHPIDYVDKNWMAEEFSGGGYVGLMGAGVMTSCGSQLRQPIGRLHFAGTETAVKWVGYMEGAIEAGERAAYEVLQALQQDDVHVRLPSSPPDTEPPSAKIPFVPCELSPLETWLPSVSMLLSLLAAALSIAVALVLL